MRYREPAWVGRMIDSTNPKNRQYAEQVRKRLKADHNKDVMLLHQSPAYNRYNYTAHGEASPFD